MRWLLLVGASILVAGCQTREPVSAISETECCAEEESPPGCKPIVVALFTGGKEAVIEPNLDELKAHGLTREQLEQQLRGRRLSEGDWKAQVGGKEVNLADVAKITVRDLRARPFTVALPDGREAVIVPDAGKVGRYLVTGEYFEQRVRDRLQDPFDDDSRETCVLGGIPVPGGRVPNAWGPDHVHISTGEPLKNFAKVSIRGRPGPQAADLAQMRSVRRHLEAGLELVKGMPRDAFEQKFGPGERHDPEPDPHFTVVPAWLYKLGPGKLQAWFGDEGSKVGSLSAWHDLPIPLAPSPDSGRLARAVADADRTLLLLFLTKRFAGSPAAEKNRLRAFLKKTNADLKWTDEEREQMAGDER